MKNPSLAHTLKRTFPALWLLYHLDETVGAGQVACFVKIDVQTARAYLNSLVDLGYAVRKTYVNGYAITPLGKQVFAPAVDEEWQVGQNEATSPQSPAGCSQSAITVNQGIEGPISNENGGKPGFKGAFSPRKWKKPGQNGRFSPENGKIPRSEAVTTTATTTKLNPEAEAAVAVVAGQSGIPGAWRQAAKGTRRKRPRAPSAAKAPGGGEKSCGVERRGRSQAAGPRNQVGSSHPGCSTGAEGAGPGAPDPGWFSGDECTGSASLVEENQQAFRDEGIGINRRVLRLCRREHVSPEFIHAQAIRLRDENRFSSNLLVYVIERNDPLPEDREAQERRRYLDNAYSDLIES